MSKIKEIRTVSQEVTVGWKCDVCDVQTTSKRQYSQEWYSFSESHRGWGNDSVESYDCFDVCSVSCFISQLQQSIPSLMEYSDDNAEIANMPVKFAQKLLDRLLTGENERGVRMNEFVLEDILNEAMADFEDTPVYETIIYWIRRFPECADKIFDYIECMIIIDEEGKLRERGKE